MAFSYSSDTIQYWPNSLNGIFGSENIATAFINTYFTLGSADSYDVTENMAISLAGADTCSDLSTRIFDPAPFNESDPLPTPLFWSCFLWPTIIEEWLNDQITISSPSVTTSISAELGQNPLNLAEDISYTVVNCLSSWCDGLLGCKQSKGPTVCSTQALLHNGSILDLNALSTCVTSICQTPKGSELNPSMIGIGIWASAFLQIVLTSIGVFVAFWTLRKYGAYRGNTIDQLSQEERKKVNRFGSFAITILKGQYFTAFTLLIAGSVDVGTSDHSGFETFALFIALSLQTTLLLFFLHLVRVVDSDRDVEGTASIIVACIAVGGGLFWLILAISLNFKFMHGQTFSMLTLRSSTTGKWSGGQELAPVECDANTAAQLCNNFDIGAHPAWLFLLAGLVIVLIHLLALTAIETATKLCCRTHVPRILEISVAVIIFVLCTVYASSMFKYLYDHDLVSYQLTFGQVAAILVWPLAFFDMIVIWLTEQDIDPSERKNQVIMPKLSWRRRRTGMKYQYHELQDHGLWTPGSEPTTYLNQDHGPWTPGYESTPYLNQDLSPPPLPPRPLHYPYSN